MVTINDCRKFGYVPFWCAAYSPGKDFELILTVKMETRHPELGPFGREFSAFVIIAELSRKTRKFCKQFLRFLGGKMTPLKQSLLRG